MSMKRMQILIDAEELARVREDARRHGMSVSDWVRAALTRVRRLEAVGEVEARLAAIDAAIGADHPTGDIDQMLAEIHAGYDAS